MPQLERLEGRTLLTADLAITEFMAANGNTLRDSEGDTPDWIEIYNAGMDPVDLAGWTLSDDPRTLDKWQLPAGTLDPDQFLLVFASGNDLRPNGNALTRDFHATRKGTFVVDLSEGLYEVQITLGDAFRARDKMAILLQDELLETRSTTAGEFVTVTALVDVTAADAGQLRVRLVDLGGETAESVINALAIVPSGGGDPVRFDFGDALSPVAPGYLPVTAASIYTGDATYGWLRGTEVFAHDRKPHTNFKLDAAGEYLALVSPAGEVVSEFGSSRDDYPAQYADISYGMTPEGPRYFMQPTPGAANGPGQLGLVSDLDISVEHGFYATPFTVEISTATPTATIRYTIDGSEPTESHGAVYAEPILVSGTITLRAAAFQGDLIPSKVETRTYLFPADVLNQDGTGLDGAPWGHIVDGAFRPDWEVDPAVVHHPDPDSRLVVDDLLTIPTVSLVMDFADMFGGPNGDGTYAPGIYNAGENVEKATSVELLNPDGRDGFQIDGSVQVVGGTSPDRWKSDKLSLRLKFNRDFGPGDLEYPVFGSGAATSFDTLVLDAHLNNVWHYGGTSDDRAQQGRAQYLRDQYTADLQLATGGYAPHDKHVHLYINGIYWGMYRLHERPDDNFAASYLGGDNDDYDVMKHNFRTAVNGSDENYLALLDATGEDLSDLSRYEAVLDVLDIDQWIDYLLVNYYVGNTDWGSQNWYASYNRVDPEGRWHFHSWDAEHVLENLTDRVVGGGPPGIHQGSKTITISDHSTDIGEAGAVDTYTIALDTVAMNAVEITVTADAQSEVSLDGGTTFSHSVSFNRRFTTPQTITVRAVDDLEAEGPHTSTITHTITLSDDPNYPTTLPIATVVATVVDNDAAGVTIKPSGGGTGIHEAGAPDTYTLALDRLPTGPVEIVVTADAQTEVSLDGGITFNASASFSRTDSTPQVITVRAVDDLAAEGPHAGTITHAIRASADPNYPTTLPIARVQASITDNDVAGVTVAASGNGTELREAGATDTYTISLDMLPAGPVVITVTADSQSEVSLDWGRTFRASADYSATDSKPQTVIVRAVDDLVREGPHTSTITHAIRSSADPNYATTLAIDSVVARVADSDLAGTTLVEGTETKTIRVGLMSSPEYRLRFADHVQKHFFNDGVFTPAGAAGLYQTRLEQIDRAVVAESARWGDNRREPAYTRGVEWIRERDRLLNEYFPQRTQEVLNQLISAGLYPAVAAPELSQHGGPVFPSSELWLTAPEGTIYFTTDGTDPRLAGGAVAPGAQPFTVPFQLTETGTVKARVLEGSQWSALTEAAFAVMSELPLRITEINYQPHDANLVPGLGERTVASDRFEFVELTNLGPDPIDLDGVQLTETLVDGDPRGITFRFAAQTLAAGEALVVVRDRSAFQSRYGTGVRIASGAGEGAADGQFGGKLDNDGEQLTLRDGQGALIGQFSYGSVAPWPARSQGHGSSLEVIDPAGDYGASTNWRASNEYGGSPGWVGSGPVTDVVINEVLAGADGADPDQVELYNATAAPVTVAGWYLSGDATDRLQARIPTGTTIAAGQYAAIDVTALGIDLHTTRAGALWLLAADDSGRPVRFVDEVSWDASDPGVALGRWPNGDPAGTVLPLASPSFGAANGALRTGAAVISEVHYHHPSLLPLLAEDFGSGTAGDFTPVLGKWDVHDGGYEVTPDTGQAAEDTIATIMTDGPLPTGFVLSATITTRTVADFKQNGALIFDYHSPTNFKFVSVHPTAATWRIGQRDAAGWRFLAEQAVRRGIPVDTEIDVTLTIQGSSIAVWSGETFFGYDFEEPLAGGQVGLASKGGAPRFDNVKLEWLGGAQDLEFVELVGTTGAPIDLDGWRLEGAVELTFPPGTQLGAGESLLVVGFDLDSPGRAAFFREAHGIEPSVILVGPYRHKLDHGGGAVELLKPVTLPGEAPGFVPVDQVQYAPQAPWPAAADGHGRALSRAAVAAPGLAATSWSALPPTPGTTRFAVPGDLNFDGRVDTDDVGRFAEVVAGMAAYQAAYGVPATLVADVDGDGDADFDDIDDFVALVGGAPPASVKRETAVLRSMKARSVAERPATVWCSRCNAAVTKCARSSLEFLGWMRPSIPRGQLCFRVRD